MRQLLDAPLDMDQAVQVAVHRNPVVRRAFHALGSARAAHAQSSLLKNPAASSSAVFFGGGSDVELGVAQSFRDPFLRSIYAQVAKAHLDAAKLHLVSELIGLVFDVQRSFVEVVIAEELVRARGKHLAVAQAAVASARELFAAGNVPELDLAAARAAEARVRLNLAAAESQEQETRESLALALGLWGEDVGKLTVAAIADVPPLEEFDEVESQAVASSLELAAKRYLVDAALDARVLACLETWLPNLQFGPAALLEPGGKWGIGLLAALELKLWDRGQAQQAAAVAQLAERLTDHEATAIVVRSAARRLRERRIAMHRRAAYGCQVHLVRARQVVAQTMLQYNGMQIGIFQVLAALEREREAMDVYLDAKRSAILAKLGLEELLAGRLGDARHPAPPPPAIERPASVEAGH
jgi:outer membrane protein TolC